MYDFGHFENKEENADTGIIIYVPYDADGKEFYAVMREHPHS